MRNGIRFLPDGKTQFTEFKRRNLMTDTFTPRTIKRFTSHENGTLYGSPTKNRTDLRNLKIYFWLERIKAMGIVGAMLGGIAVAKTIQILRNI